MTAKPSARADFHLAHQTDVREDEFLKLEDLVPVRRDAAGKLLNQVLAETEELFREKKWADMLALFYPVGEKLPEITEYGMDTRIREKLAFALGQLNRFDDAIAELSVCVQREPDNFYPHSSLAYTAYNSLYAAKNREIFLSGKVRAERIGLAHRHFKAAQTLRPDGVTNFYREGMLFKQIEGKTVLSLPLFQRAVTNWERLDRDAREQRHQERKNYIKSLYQLSGALLDRGRSRAALTMMKRCIAEDEQSGHISLVFKYFALGKIHFHLNRFPEAKDALLFAIQCGQNRPIDYVHELLARTYLAMGNAGRAMEIINRTPAGRRRPFYCWTEADVRCALGDFDGAREVLRKSSDRDNRSRHKALLRLVKIEYLMQNYKKAADYAAAAGDFFKDRWGNILRDALFWQATCAWRLGDRKKALELALTLKADCPGDSRTGRLLEKLKAEDRQTDHAEKG